VTAAGLVAAISLDKVGARVADRVTGDTTVTPPPAVGVAASTAATPAVPASHVAVTAARVGVAAGTFSKVGASVADRVTGDTTVTPPPATSTAFVAATPAIPASNSAVDAARTVASGVLNQIGAAVADRVTGDTTVTVPPAVGVAASTAATPPIPASNPAVTAGNVTTTTAAIIKETTATASPLGRLRSCFLQVHSVGKTAGTNR